MTSKLNNTKDFALYSQLSQSKAREAINIYKRLGLEQRVKDIERWIMKSSSTMMLLAIPLPNPFAHNIDAQDSINDVLKNYGFSKKEEDPMEHEFRSLQAKAMSLENRLKDLEDRRDQGKLDESRYQDLARGYDQERLEVLFQIQKVLEGKDEDLDKVIQSAISGEADSVLRQELSKMAKKKGFGDKIVEQLNEHKGTIISWILEIGFQIAKRVS